MNITDNKEPSLEAGGAIQKKLTMKTQPGAACGC